MERLSCAIVFIGLFGASGLNLDRTSAINNGDLMYVNDSCSLQPGEIWWLHVPKSGTSFANTLVTWACPGLEDDDIIDSSWTDSFGWYIPNFMKANQDKCDDGFNLPGGHRSMSDEVWKSYQGSFVSLFRQPEQRIISGYHYGLHDVDNKSLSILEYAERVAGCAVNMMSGKECGSGEATMDMAEEAISRLHQGFAFVGLTEEWSLSVCLFHAMFGGLCHSREFQNVREGEYHTDMSYSAEDLLNWTDAVDNALYDHAAAVFWHNVQLYGVSRETCMSSICVDVPTVFDS